ncbi:Ppx/GppA phosphatase family protein [Sphingorhabdus sp.]|jgi:exopolyphosphatase/guanosine-5'-triphosphate,3'-diphosphate pyrophosphatase|uniref:Ppx/GppA phosphatase family protein n=1 Tax=Sphingorhabdus sp. TaxID=1902408 RepID=UPI002C214EA1|nr:Ppx/GppA phosphatase family protein [Sphingorhabdus sp.]HMT40029.1 Ppx/GppA phosphatase family protein [Sphingorhabdus sp.]
MIQSPRAVIDIGSNAIRLVVYGGPARAPMPIYNEKARVALGESVAKSGGITPETMEQAIAALQRFDALTIAMNVGERHVVATEATRQAKNGGEFLLRAAKAGVPIDLITGEEEARASALGVVCDMPWATGYVADQGGGSLELAKVENGEPQQPLSMPFGTIPLSKSPECSPKSIAHDIEERIEETDGFEIRKNLPLHLVGGAWRTLAQLHMHATGYPLTILSNYSMPLDAGKTLAELVANRSAMEQSGVVSNARLPFMSTAYSTMEALIRVFEPSEIIVSVYGLREGLLFDRLSSEQRNEDPLIAAARHEGARLSRFAYHGDRIANWIAPIFMHDPQPLHRLRKAVCLLADSAWNSHPEYRAEHAAELALEGNWPGVTASDRAVMAAGLYASYGGKKTRPPLLSLLATDDLLDRATLWGLAVRLAQRLDGGTGIGLEGVALMQESKNLNLQFEPEFAHLDSPTVRRRLKQLNDIFVGKST